jgi:nucleoside permease NupC
MFSLLAFFIASAAFRAFRARNVEATLMLATSIVVMLGVIPVGEWIHEGMPELKDWILNYANNAGRRAILIGAALGAVATGLRVILGIERSHLGSDK